MTTETGQETAILSRHLTHHLNENYLPAVTKGAKPLALAVDAGRFPAGGGR